MPARHRHALRWGAFLVALLVVLASSAVVAVGYVAADRLVHPPREVGGATPMNRGVPFDRIVFPSEDEIPLVGWWMPAHPAALGTVIFLHGYSSSKSQSLAVAPFLHRAGFNVLAFDFRAHGESGGSFTTLGLEEVKDVKGAHAWLAQRGDVDMSRVVLFGWSMGGAAALLAAPQLPDVRALVADSTFARLDGTLSRSFPRLTGLPWYPFGIVTMQFAAWTVGHGPQDAAPERAARDLHRPLLLIQGEKDGLATPSDAMSLGEAAGFLAEVWLVPGADHTGARHTDARAYEQRVVAFLVSSLGLDLASGEGILAMPVGKG